MIMVGSWMAKRVVCSARYYSVNKLNNTARNLWDMRVHMFLTEIQWY